MGWIGGIGLLVGIVTLWVAVQLAWGRSFFAGATGETDALALRGGCCECSHKDECEAAGTCVEETDQEDRS